MSTVMLICAGVAALAALASLRYLPGRAAPVGAARYESTAVTEANRALAVATAAGPAAGLAILDSLGTRLARWPQLHIGRAELLHRDGRTREAIWLPGRAGVIVS